MLESGDLDVAAYDLGPATGGDAPLTYLHGFPSSALDMLPVVGKLGSSARPVAIDFPGFGASDKPTGHPYSIHAAADAVEVMWEEFGITSSVLWAHDYGATVAQELIARHLENTLVVGLDAVVWHNAGLYPHLHRPTPGQRILLDPEEGPRFAAQIDESAFAAAIRGTWGERRPMRDEETHEMWCSMVHNGGTRIADQLLHYVAERRRFGARWQTALEQSELPAWFVWGDLDPVSGAPMIEEVQARVPHGQVLRLADVGHWPPLEAPDEVTDAVLAALDAG
jgi:pimeloyl-ACP methyl ester carboxylesterase